MALFTENKRAFAQDFLDFMNEASTAYHAVLAAKKRLESAGFMPIDEREAWSVVPGGKYYFTRNGTTIVAITVGEDYKVNIFKLAYSFIIVKFGIIPA